MTTHDPSPTELEPLDDNLLISYVESRLTDEERDVVEERLVHDAEARTLVRALRSALPATEAASSVAPRRLPLAPLAIAASVLVAVGVLWVLWGRDEPPPPESFASLLAAADRLAADDGERFGGLRAAITASGPAVRATVDRGGLRVLAPHGESLTARPEIRWVRVAGASRYEIRIATESGEDVRTFSADHSPMAWPADAEPLTDGTRYLLEVRTRGPFGEHTTTSMFRIADATARADHAAARAAIESRTSGDERTLLLAFHAASRERYAVALEGLTELEAHMPDDARVKRLRALLAPMVE